MKALFQVIAYLFIIPAALAWPTNSFAQPAINEIRFEKTSAYEERVLLVMEEFHPPEAFDLTGPTPRLVFDFFTAILRGSVSTDTVTDGKLIKRIRVGRHTSPPKKVRLVLDLAPDNDYKVNQVFFEKSGIYAIMVTLSKPSNSSPKKKPLPSKRG